MSRKEHLDAVIAYQDRMAAAGGATARAIHRARPHLAAFHQYCDENSHLLPDQGEEFLRQITAWWLERGLVIEFYFLGRSLMSRSHRCVEDVS